MEQLIRTRVAEHPDQTWLKWKDEEVPWRGVLSQSQRVANGLLELGVRPGDRVALMMANRPEFLWTYFGIGFIGAMPVPVNISQRGPALRHVLGDSGVVAAVFHADLLDVVKHARDALGTLRYLVIADGDSDSGGGGADWTLDRLLSAEDREPDVTVDRPTGATGLMYTSGTTGPPKGVLTTGHDPTSLAALVKVIGVQPGQTMYTGLPLFHGNALYQSALGSMLADAKLALAPKFTASGLLDDCRRFDVSVFSAVGGIASILLKQPKRADDRDNPVHTVVASGAPAERWREFEERFGVRLVEWYGMVDAPGFLVNAGGKVGAMGTAGLGDVEFRVVDENDEPLGPCRVGELVFKHPQGQLTLYNNLPEATNAAYRGGWFHTGDLAERDEDGWFFFRGRKTESMRRLGENISAWEIETTLNEHPDVLESAAHAVASPLGEDEVKVCVVRQPDSHVQPEELLKFCRREMSRYAVPRYVEFMDTLPKTPTERIQYATLKARGVTSSTYDSSADDRR